MTQRFYDRAEARTSGEGFGIFLDDRAVRTPLGNALIVPHARLAEAIADEWEGQQGKIVPQAMTLTGLANSAIDQVPANRESFIDTIAAYGESDMLCYRADADDPLAAHQAAHWNPLLDWAEHRYDIALVQVHGIAHKKQDDTALGKLRDAVAASSDLELAAMAQMVPMVGSLICVLALLEGRIDTKTLWPLIHLEELWQVEHWGEDVDAKAAREARFTAFDAAARFAMLASA